MGEFVRTALSFPAVLFSFLLVVVVAYWVLVLLGGAGLDALDGDGASDAGHEAGALSALGLGGVPATVAVSLLIALSWFGSLSGTALLGDPPALARVAVLVAAPVCAWLVTRLLVLPLRRVFAIHRAPSRKDFVGRTCVIRTGRVGSDFGQAEVRASDGSSAVIQVRQMQWPSHALRDVLDAEHPSRGGSGPEPSTGDEQERRHERALRAGDTALIFDHDADGEFFWVTPYDAELDPDAPTR
ncbi:hypothetical protein [Sphaerisporangium perillae]|uniref:hypothetical protein n=1 Tax=Sphaerisporangium perillae TaxID=2935860 RepID=UPI00200CBA83|nr:hypothetical protein [Sphaerisporangium perillae]